MKTMTRAIIALIIAILMTLGGSLLLSFNLVIPFAITLIAFGGLGSLSIAITLPFIHELFGENYYE